MLIKKKIMNINFFENGATYFECKRAWEGQIKSLVLNL